MTSPDGKCILLGELLYTKEEVETMFWEKTITQIARDHGISNVEVLRAFESARLKERFEEELASSTRARMASARRVDREFLSARLDSLGIPRSRARNRWAFLAKDVDGTPLSKVEREKRAAQLLVGWGYKPGEVISWDQLKRDGHAGFTAAAYRHGLDLGVVASIIGCKSPSTRLKQELKVRGVKMPGKWHMYRYDNDGNLLPRADKLARWSGLVKNLISLSCPTSTNGSVFGTIPTLASFKKEHPALVSAMHKSGIRWNDIARYIGLSVNCDPSKWREFDIDDLGNPLSLSEQVEKFAHHLREFIVTPEFQIVHELNENTMPTQDLLERSGHGDFTRAISNRSLTLPMIGRALGWTIHHEDKWIERLNEKITLERQTENWLDILACHVKNGIMTPEFTQDNKIEVGLAPSVELLRGTGHGDFISFCYRENISVKEVFEKAGLNVAQDHDQVNLGRQFHAVAEHILIQHAAARGCTAFPELPLRGCGGGSKGTRQACDLAFKVDEALETLSPELFQFLQDRPRVGILLVDFFLGQSGIYTRDHCTRGYQSKDRALACVPSYCTSPRPPPEGIPWPHNVLVLDPSSLCNILGLEGELRMHFLETVQLSKEATWDPESASVLKELARESRLKLKLIRKRGWKQWDVAGAKGSGASDACNC